MVEYKALLRGGPGDGMVVTTIEPRQRSVEYGGYTYVRTAHEAPLPGDDGQPGPGGATLVQRYAVYEVRP